MMRRRLHAGESCSLKHHFRGCTRQVIGLFERRARIDYERFTWMSFTWMSMKDMLANAVDIKGHRYSERMVRYVVRFLEARGLILPCQRTRSGKLFRGWIVAAHRAAGGAWCQLILSRENCRFEGRKLPVQGAKIAAFRKFNRRRFSNLPQPRRKLLHAKPCQSQLTLMLTLGFRKAFSLTN